MRIELTIKSEYLPDWSSWEGIREIIQNAQDGHVDGYPMTIKHSNSTLYITNVGTHLPHRALLFGHTTKTDRSDQIGKFGEGLKLGTLALVRAGHKVRIRSNSEIWTPKFVMSKKFDGEKILAFDIRKGKEHYGITVEISIEKEQWDEYKNKFIFLGDRDGQEIISTDNGSLLFDEKEPGNIFVKGIFVQNEPKLLYSYNFSNIDVDRDRRMISSWDLEYALISIWTIAAKTNQDRLYPIFWEMLFNDSFDLKGLSASWNYMIDENLRSYIRDRFIEKYGTNAMPVSNLSESKILEHFGKNGIIVTAQLKNVLSNGKSFDKVQTELSKEIVKKYSWSELTPDERSNIDEAIKLINESKAAEVSLEFINIVNFNSVNIRGMYINGTIFLGKNILNNKDTTLRVLVHEVAHYYGGDGEKSHVSKMEEIWSDIVTGFRS